MIKRGCDLVYDKERDDTWPFIKRDETLPLITRDMRLGLW